MFNEVYDEEHVPLLNKVPGVVSVARFKRQELTLAIGGELRTIVVEDEPEIQRDLRSGARGCDHQRRLDGGIGVGALA